MIQVKNSSVVLLICVIVFVCVGLLGWSQQGRAFSNVVWEYKVVYIPIDDAKYAQEPEPTMNRLGSEGWEFVQIMDSNNTHPVKQGYFIFKRAK